MSSFKKDKRESKEWLHNPSYSKLRTEQMQLLEQMSAAAQAKQQDTVASSMQTREMSMRSNSMEDINGILRNPYELSQGEMLKHGSSFRQEERSNGTYSTKTTALSKNAAKSVPFGTGTRRPVAESTISEIVQFTYLPDLRRINAEQQVQLKEEKHAKKLRQLNQKNLVAKMSQVASEKRINSKTSLKKLMISANKPSYQNQSNDYLTRRMPTTQLKRPQDINIDSKMTQIMNRSKSNVEKLGINLSSNKNTLHNLRQLNQVESDIQFHQQNETLIQEDTQPILKSSIREREPSYEEDLGLTTLHGEGPKSGRAASITGRPGRDPATSDDASAQAEQPGVLNSQNSTLHNVPQQVTGQKFQIQSQASAEDYMHDAVGGQQLVARHAYTGYPENYDQKTIVHDQSRLLLGSDSVQQLTNSRATLQVHLPNSNSRRKLSKKASSRKNSSQRIALFGQSESRKSLANVTVKSAFSGLVQSRKLAPKKNQKDELLAAVAQHQESQRTIQIQRSLRMEQSQEALNNMGAEFLEQLHGNIPIQQTPNRSLTQGFASLPQLPNINSSSMLSSNTTFMPQPSRELSQSRLLLSKRRLKNQYQTTKHEKDERVKVLEAQNLHHPDISAFKLKQQSQSKQNDPISRSIPIRIKATTDRNESSIDNDKIPAKMLQQELTNERSYTRVAPKKKTLTKNDAIPDVVVTASQNQVSILQTLDSSAQDIIPRLSQFPMKGQTIVVAGHDENEIFFKRSHRKDIDSKLTTQQYQTLQTEETQAQKSKRMATEKRKALHQKSRKSINALLEKNPTKKELFDIENQPGVRKHYLDDEIRGRKFMKNVGPATYDTYEKIHTVPTSLKQNLAPAAILKDVQDNLKRFQQINLSSEKMKETEQTQEQDSSLISLEPMLQLSGEIKVLNPVAANQNYNKPVSSRESSLNRELQLHLITLPDEKQSFNDKNSRNIDNTATIEEKIINQSIESKSVSVRDSVDFNTANEVYHQIVMPAIHNSSIISTEIQPSESNISTSNILQAINGQRNSTSVLIEQNIKITPIKQKEDDLKAKRPIKGKSRALKLHENSSSNLNQVDFAIVSDRDVMIPPTEAKQLQQLQRDSSLAKRKNQSSIDTKLSKTKRIEKGTTVVSQWARQKKNQSGNKLITQQEKDQLPELLTQQLLVNPNAGAKHLQSQVISHRSKPVFKVPQAYQQSDATPVKQIGAGAMQMSPDVFTTAKLSHRSNETLNKSLKKPNPFNAENLNIQRIQRSRKNSNKGSEQLINQDLSPIMNNLKIIQPEQQPTQSPHQRLNADLNFNSQINTEVDQSLLNSIETEPPLQVNPNNAGDMQLLMAINQQQVIYDAQSSTTSLKDLIKQVETMKKERQIQNQSLQPTTYKSGAVIGRDARFKQSEKVLNIQQTTPGPGSYNTVHAKDVRQAVSNSKKPQAVMKQQEPKGKIQKDGDQVSAQSVDIANANTTSDHTKSIEQLQAKLQLEIIDKKAVAVDQRSQVVKDLKERPSANFQSKVPRKTYEKEENKQKEYTGEVDFNDIQANTISKAQNELTLKSVQKMFATRTEQHTLNVQNLVRINRLKQLNKADPLINHENTSSQANNTHFNNDQMTYDEQEGYQDQISDADRASVQQVQQFMNQEQNNDPSFGFIILDTVQQQQYMQQQQMHIKKQQLEQQMQVRQYEQYQMQQKAQQLLQPGSHAQGTSNAQAYDQQTQQVALTNEEDSIRHSSEQSIHVMNPNGEPIYIYKQEQDSTSQQSHTMESQQDQSKIGSKYDIQEQNNNSQQEQRESVQTIKLHKNNSLINIKKRVIRGRKSKVNPANKFTITSRSAFGRFVRQWDQQSTYPIADFKPGLLQIRKGKIKLIKLLRYQVAQRLKENYSRQLSGYMALNLNQRSLYAPDQRDLTSPNRQIHCSPPCHLIKSDGGRSMILLPTNFTIPNLRR